MFKTYIGCAIALAGILALFALTIATAMPSTGISAGIGGVLMLVSLLITLSGVSMIGENQ